MNKILTKIAVAFVGIAMAVGVGVAAKSSNVREARGASGTNISLSTSPDKSTTNGTAVSPVRLDTTVGLQLSVNLSGNNGKWYGSGTEWRLYQNNNPTVVLSIDSDYYLDAVTFTYSVQNTGVLTYGGSNKTSGTKITLPGDSNTASFGVGNTGSATNGQVRLTAAQVWYSSAGSGDPDKLATPSPVFNRAENTITWATVEGAESYQLKVDSGSFSTQSSGYSVAGVSVNDQHTVYVKALADGKTTSEEGSVTFHRYATKGTSTDPYTVADARRAIDDNEGLSDVYATGIVSAIPTAYDSGHSNITFNLIDEGGSDFLQAYRCSGTDAANVAIGDTAVVSGTLTKYNSTYEFGQGCTLVSLVHPVVETSYDVTFDADGGTDPDPKEVGEGLTFTFPSAGTKANSLFKGWSSDGSHFYQQGDTSPAVNADIEYTAYWQTKGLVGDPYTVAQAKSAIDDNAGIKGVHVSGIISQVDSYSSNTITYWISDDGTTADQMEVYKGKGLNEANFSAKEDVEVGATVVVYGNLKKYNTTYEFDSGNYQTSYTAPAAITVESIEISGSMTKTSYTTAEQWDPTGLTVTANFSNSTSSDVTASVTWSYYNSSDVEKATPNAFGEATGQTLKIKATYEGEEDTTTATVNVEVAALQNTTNLVQGNYYIAYNDSGTKHYISSVASGKGATVTNKNNALVFAFALVGDDTWEITNDNNYLGVGSSSTSLTLDSTKTTLEIQWENETNGTRKITGSSGRELAWYSSGSDIRTYSGKTDGTNGMTLEAAKTVSSFSVYSEGANKNVLKGSTFNAAAAAAAGFEARLNYTDSTYDDVTASATWTLDTSTAGTATLTVSYLEYTPVVFNDMTIFSATIVSLSIDSSGAKTSYVEGEALNTAGLVITGYDSGSNEYEIAIGDCTFSPANGAVLATNNTSVSVTYTNENSSTASTTYSITVSAFVGYTKVTSVEGLAIGESYVLGVENDNHVGDLMGNASAATQSAYRNKVDASAAFNNAKTTVTQSGASTAGAVIVTLLSDGNGKYAFYDITNDKYLAGKTSTSSSNHLYNNDTLSDAGDTAWWTISFEDGLMSVVLNGTNNRVLGYNLSQPRFSTYTNYAANSTTATSGTAHPVLFKMVGSSVKTSVTSFANDSLKMNDDNYNGDKTTANCASNYSAMKSAYANLTDAEKNVLQFSSDFAAAKARMNKWAIANGETFTYGEDQPFASLAISTLNVARNNNATTIAVIMSLLSVTALGALFFMKKKKEQ